jgi:hypothetical protein
VRFCAFARPLAFGVHRRNRRLSLWGYRFLERDAAVPRSRASLAPRFRTSSKRSETGRVDLAGIGGQSGRKPHAMSNAGAIESPKACL